jgi:hypothetical protein
MRRPILACLAALSILAPLNACSDHAALPTMEDNPRIYVDPCDPPPESKGGSTFVELYHDIFSINGVAKCQSSSCHGNPDHPTGGFSQLSADTHSADARGEYCALTTHAFDGRHVVEPHLYDRTSPTGSDAKACCDTGDQVVGAERCATAEGVFTASIEGACVVARATSSSGDAGPDASDADGGADADSGDATADAADGGPSAVPATACVVAHCGKDSTADSALLDEVLKGYMPRPLPCGGNRKLLDSEKARIGVWLARGAPFDGELAPRPTPACQAPDPL